MVVSGRNKKGKWYSCSYELSCRKRKITPPLSELGQNAEIKEIIAQQLIQAEVLVTESVKISISPI